MTEFVQGSGLGLSLIGEQFAAHFKTRRTGFCRDFRPGRVAVAANGLRAKCTRHDNHRDFGPSPDIFDRIAEINLFHRQICP
jgi:hypothetical protein